MFYTGAPDECSFCWSVRSKIEKHSGECPFAKEADDAHTEELTEFANSILKFNLPRTPGNALLEEAAVRYLDQLEQKEEA